MSLLKTFLSQGNPQIKVYNLYYTTNWRQLLQARQKEKDCIRSCCHAAFVEGNMKMVYQIALSALLWLLENQCLVLMGKSNSNDKLKIFAELNVSLTIAQLEKQIRSGFKTQCH